MQQLYQQMREYTIQLEPYKGKESRYPCPSCGKAGRFTRYIDMITAEYISSEVGRCERVNNCGYHYTPKQFYEDHDIHLSDEDRIKHKAFIQKVITTPRPEPSYIPFEYVQKSLEGMDKSNFMRFLHKTFGSEKVNPVAARYLLGQYYIWQDHAPIFWQISEQGVHAGKLMKYNQDTGKRVKKPFNHINWMHSILKLPSFNLDQCLYGLHLISSDRSKVIAITESEKSSIIASMYFQDMIWLATGGIMNLNPSKFTALKRRKIVLFPDKGAFDLWLSKADEIAPYVSDIEVSDLLERKGIKMGSDIADVIIKEVQSIRR